DDPDAAAMKLCISYFQPMSPHFPRLRFVQYFLTTGCSDAQSFYMAQLPIYHPALPPSTYGLNNPNVWVLLGMLVTYNHKIAKAFLRSIDWDFDTAFKQELVVSFLNRVEDGVVQVETYHGTLWDVTCKRDVGFEPWEEPEDNASHSAAQ